MKQVSNDVKVIEVSKQNKTYFILAKQIGSEIWFHLNGCVFILSTKTKLHKNKQTLLDTPSSKVFVLAPIPGQIMEILITKDQKVEKNQALLILSAMKMEYTLKAKNSGQVLAIKVRTGDFVILDQELILIKEKL